MPPTIDPKVAKCVKWVLRGMDMNTAILRAGLQDTKFQRRNINKHVQKQRGHTQAGGQAEAAAAAALSSAQDAAEAAVAAAAKATSAAQSAVAIVKSTKAEVGGKRTRSQANEVAKLEKKRREKFTMAYKEATAERPA